jgi:hypothetical protein
MVRPIIIGVAGTHSTGKSTFCNELKVMLEANGIDVASIQSFGKLAAQNRIPILTEHTYDSTMWFIERTLEAQQAATCSVVLVDRPVIDALAYWNAAVEYRQAFVCPIELTKVCTAVSVSLPHYSTTLATKLDDSIPIGTGRDKDQNFRRSVDLYLHRLLNDFSVIHEQLYPQTKERLLSSLCTQICAQLGHS